MTKNLKLMELNFNNKPMHVIKLDEKWWITTTSIGQALELKEPRKGVYAMRKNHASEFSDEMVRLIILPTASGKQKTRIFSLSGASLITFWTKPEMSGAFRKWLCTAFFDKQISQSVLLPVAEQKGTISVEINEYIDLLRSKIELLQNANGSDRN